MIVSVKTDCPHILQIPLYPLEKFKQEPFEKYKCKYCEINTELWICISCSEAFCGRYMNNHYQKHLKENPEHSICISLLDLSVWCYLCETEGFSDLGSYIESPKTIPYIQILSDFKFGDNFSPSKNNINDKMKMDKDQIFNIKYGNFIEMLKNKKFINGCFLVGSGISVNSGIPDFKGIYHNISKKYNLEKVEDFFSKDLFIQKPQLLYEFLKELKFDSYKPNLTHYFMKYLIDNNIVGKIYTQNIDGLELKAGIDKEKVCFVHGNLLESNCMKCNEKIDIKELKELIEKGEIKYCPKCNIPCKPNIILYGENLDKKVGEEFEKIQLSDIGFIIGTSLKVEPFSLLPFILKSWVILINKEEVGDFDFNNIINNHLFLEGNCEDLVKKILKDCNWWDDFCSKYNIN